MKGDRIGVDASTMEANAALRNIVRRDPSGLHRRRQEIRIKFLAPCVSPGKRPVHRIKIRRY